MLKSESIQGETVPRIVSEGRVDLVMMGSYGGGLGNVDQIFFGSTAEAVERTAGCPVLTVPLPPKPKR